MSESSCSSKPAFTLALAIVLAMAPVMFPLVASASVEVRDTVTVKGRSVMLSARTGGTFLSIGAEGGKVVEFSVEGKVIGKTLSGGDAVAYMEYTSKKKGLYELLARSGRDENMGLLLVAESGASVLLVDVAGALFKDPIGRDSRDDTLEALKTLGSRYQIIYLYSRLFGLKHARKWLRDKGFPLMPVLGYQQGRTVRHLRLMGLSVEAIVTGPVVIGGIQEMDVKVFTFDKEGEGEQVSTWEEVREALLGSIHNKQ